MVNRSAYDVAQTVLEHFTTKDLSTALELTKDQGQTLMVALNGIDTNGEIVNLSGLLTQADLHSSMIRSLKLKDLITRKTNEKPWKLTKNALKKLQSMLVLGDTALADEDLPSDTSTAESDASDQLESGPRALKDMPLSVIIKHVQDRIVGIEERIEQIKRTSAEEIRDIEGRRDFAIADLEKERSESLESVRALNDMV